MKLHAVLLDGKVNALYSLQVKGAKFFLSFFKPYFFPVFLKKFTKALKSISSITATMDFLYNQRSWLSSFFTKDIRVISVTNKSHSKCVKSVQQTLLSTKHRISCSRHMTHHG